MGNQPWLRAAMLCGFLLVSAPSPAAIVYDNTTTDLGFFSGLGDFWRGDQITLGGAERVVTGFRFGYLAPTNAGSDGVLRFYANDGAGGVPGTILFETNVQFLLTGTYQDIVLAGLSVLVPDTFTWAVSLPRVGLQLWDPPTVGASDDFHWFSADNAATWSQINFATSVDNFRAQVTAEAPEPGAFALIALGLAGLGWSRRRGPGLPRDLSLRKPTA